MANNRWIKPAAVGALAIASGIVGHFEGSRTKAYLDPVGIPTICSGHILGVKMGDTATAMQCDQTLQADLKVYLAYVDGHTAYKEPDSRRAALTSFCFNVGTAACGTSTTFRLLNARPGRDVKGACMAMNRWVYAGGRILPGLVARRKDESDLCLEGLQ